MKRKHSSPEIQKQIESHVPKDVFTTMTIRCLSRAGFEAALPYIISVAKGEVATASPAVSVRALDILGKYCMGPQPDNIFIENKAWMDDMFQSATNISNDQKTTTTGSSNAPPVNTTTNRKGSRSADLPVCTAGGTSTFRLVH